MANAQNRAAHLPVSAPKPGETATSRPVARSTEDPGKHNESMRRVARFRSHTVKPNSTKALDMMAYPETRKISLTPHVESIYVQPRP